MSITIREVQQRVFFALTAAGHLVNSLDIVFVLDPYGHGDKATEKWIATNKDPAVQSLWYNERERPGLFWTSGSDKRFSLKEMLSCKFTFTTALGQAELAADTACVGKTISTLYVLITDYDSEEKAIWTDSLACHKVIAAHYMGYKYRSGDGRNRCALSPDVYFYYDRSILSKRLASADDVKEQTLYPTNDSKLSKVAVSPATIAPCAEMQDRTIEPVLSTTRLPSRMPSSNPEESLVIIVFDMAAWNFFTQSHHQVSPSVKFRCYITSCRHLPYSCVVIRTSK
jgi:hypothetical protein